MKTVYAPTHLLHAPAKEFLDGRLIDVFETPLRAELILRAVRDAQLGPVLPPDDLGPGPIRRIHAADYLEFLQSAYGLWVAEGRDPAALYPDTFFKPPFLHRPTRPGALAGIYMMDLSAPLTGGTWLAAYWSAQCALTAARLIQQGEHAAFALCRPPGHHAHANIAGGYCYLNNAAISAQWLRDTGAARVTVLDIDVHHGNGTQHIFYTRADVQFISLHGDPDWEYPYFLGGADEKGLDAGLGFNHNHPLPRGANGAQFLAGLELACAEIHAYAPDALVISLGVDTFEGDPLGGLGVEAGAYPLIGARLAQLGLPTLFVMEGGYAIAPLGVNVAAVLSGFSG